ncbi:MAG: hypothetical protein ACR2PK_15560 [Acidimicrobiales bacterium]
MTTAATETGVTKELKHHSVHGHFVHRLGHAIYGLIVLVAVVGDLSTHDDDMRHAIVIVASGAVVLVFAHSYSQLIAAASMTSESPRSRLFVASLLDQLALAIPAAIAVFLFFLAEADVISDRAAYNIVLTGSLLTLFGLGLAVGRHRGKAWVWTISVAIANFLVGFAIIGIEAAAAH